MLVIAPTIAFVGMAVWILWDADTPRSASANFISTPQFVLWLLILCGQAAVWALASGFVWITLSGRLRDLWRSGELGPARLAGMAAALLILVLTAVVLAAAPKTAAPSLWSVELRQLPKGGEFPLEQHSLKIAVVVAIGLVIGFAAIAGIWATAMLLNRLRPENPPTREDLERFLALRRDLTSLLAVAGALIGLATLATGALRLAVLATDRLQFASEYVVAYGLFFTGLLAIGFAPAFLAMRGAGARLRDSAHPLSAPNDADFAEVIARRAALDVVLETNLSASATFKAGVAILTPLAGSLLGLVLPGA